MTRPSPSWLSPPLEESKKAKDTLAALQRVADAARALSDMYYSLHAITPGLLDRLRSALAALDKEAG